MNLCEALMIFNDDNLPLIASYFIINVTWTLAISEKERKFANPPEYSVYKANREHSNKNCNISGKHVTRM